MRAKLPRGLVPDEADALRRVTQLREVARATVRQTEALKSQRNAAKASGQTERYQQLTDLIGDKSQRAWELEERAAQEAFVSLNAHADPDVINLHWLYVRQALPRLDSRIAADAVRGRASLRADVGIGMHSVPSERLRPAVTAHCRDHWGIVASGFPTGHWWRRFLEIDLRPLTKLCWAMRACFLCNDRAVATAANSLQAAVVRNKPRREFAVRVPTAHSDIKPLTVRPVRTRRGTRLTVAVDASHPTPSRGK